MSLEITIVTYTYRTFGCSEWEVLVNVSRFAQKFTRIWNCEYFTAFFFTCTPAVNVSLSCCSLLYHLRFYLFPIFGECINKSLKGSLFGEEQKLNESATDISEQKARDIYDNSSLLSHRRFSAHLKKEENNFVSNCFRYYSKQKSTTASKRGRKEGKLTIGATQKTKVLLHHLSNLFHYF